MCRMPRIIILAYKKVLKYKFEASPRLSEAIATISTEMNENVVTKDAYFIDQALQQIAEVCRLSKLQMPTSHKVYPQLASKRCQ